ncbi:DNA polymerase III subunit alpha [Numidum massiliense]|uniref:DNA polymerase III subunit alpha n=1 Tax=Numidum massiliense TaxID=1522315 RepID=UPI000A5C66F0|nr:DNA polymerase III subunit alpha [Numidum massiliense]
MTSFVHLHVHTPFSLLDGAAPIPRLVTQAKKLGMDYLALTDHGVLHGVVPFYRLCEKVGIQPIIGCEVYVAKGRMSDRVPPKTEKIHHLVLLAENAIGYRNLLQLSSEAHLRGFYYKPRVDKQILRQYSEGLIALSSCLAGEVNHALLNGEVARGRELAEEYRDIFGSDNFFLELQDHGLPEQKVVNRRLIALSEQTGIPLVATNDVHYVDRADRAAHDCLLCIGTGAKLSDRERLRFASDQYYLKSGAEMASLFRHVPEALANTVRIARRCQLTLDFDQIVLPAFPLPQGRTAAGTLKELAYRGAERRYGEVDDAVKSRLDHELRVIDEMGFNDYFLIVWDFVRYAHERGIATGPGRGSAAGSLVSYCLRITDIDPLKYNLLFERFLNPGRRTMPDIDIDFNYERRDEVIQYVIDKYGADRVAQIATFGTLAPRAAVRDVGRVMGLAYKQVDQVAKCIPNAPGMTMEKAFAASPDLKALVARGSEEEALIGRARQLEGFPRHVSTHAAGVVIAPESLTRYVPLMRGSDGDHVLTQYPMEDLEAIGLLKMDFLGLRNLTVIERTIASIEAHTGERVSFAAIGDDDRQTYDMLARGDTTGVFQLESAGMRRVLRELQPTRFEDVIAVLALYRPGPMEHIGEYIEARHGRREVTYLHPDLEPILNDTFGIIVYQEQIMQIAAKMAGFSLEEADLLRRAVGKKKHDVLAEQRERFVRGCVSQQYDAALGHQLYDLIVRFADYGFNRAHAAAYAVLAYQTAYLKAHYPHHFMAALLTTVMGSHTKLAEYIDDCRQLGIDVLPPDVNASDAHFTVEGGAIRFGLAAVKNVGAQAIAHIVETRQTYGTYRDLFHLCERIDTRLVNKRMLESLVLAGATASLPGHRAQHLSNLDVAVDRGARLYAERTSRQMSLFVSEAGAGRDQPPALRDTQPFSRRKELQLERELLGLYLSGHPLEAYRQLLERANVTAISRLGRLPEQAHVRVAGLVSAVKGITTKKGEPMAFVTLEDVTQSVDVVVFPRVYDAQREAWQVDELLLVSGRVNHRGDGVGVIAADARRLPATATSAPESPEPPMPTSPESSMPASPESLSPAPLPSRAATVNAKVTASAGQGSSPAAQPEATSPTVRTPPQTARTTTAQEQAPKQPASQDATPTPPGTASPTQLFVRIPADSAPDLLQRLKHLISRFPGTTPVLLYYADSKRVRVLPPDKFGVDWTECRRDLEALCGEENVRAVER